MRQSDIATLFDYARWSNARILNAAAGLDDTHFCTPQLPDLGSLRAILVHVYGAEWVWRSRCAGTSPTSMPKAEDFASVAQLTAAWHEEEAAMCALIEGLDDARLDNEITYQTMNGKAMHAPLWHILTHAIIHGAQHRAEAAALLTTLGRSPGDIDFIYYDRERQDEVRA